MAPSEEKKIALRKKKTFFHRAKNFRAHAGKFLCAQKNIFVRTKIYFLPQGNFTLCERRLIPLNNKQLGKAQKLPYPRLLVARSEGRSEAQNEVEEDHLRLHILR